MVDRLSEAIDWTRADDGQFEGELTDEWANGSGAYGGIIAASLLRQMTRTLDDEDQSPRTLHAHLGAPLRFEPATARVRIDRRGRSISQVSTRLSQKDEVSATASATFAGDRSESSPRTDLPRPDTPPPEEVEPAPDLPIMPVYLTNFFEMRFCIGDLPLSGSETAETGGWLSTREPFADGPELAVCLLDAWPPSVFPTYETFRRTVTVDHRFQFWEATDRDGTTHEPFLFHATSEIVDDGYAREDAAVWSREGNLVATAQQLYAILD
ncbi:MAG: acyl-CoA thioesterase [Bradymonadaceae bacterium]